MRYASAQPRTRETDEEWERVKAHFMHITLAKLAPYIKDGTVVRFSTETRPKPTAWAREEFILYADID
jgi:cytochrome b561